MMLVDWAVERICEKTYRPLGCGLHSVMSPAISSSRAEVLPALDHAQIVHEAAQAGYEFLWLVALGRW